MKKNKIRNLSRNLPDVTKFMLNQLGNRINKAIQDGIDAGKDIEGKSFEPLSEKTSAPQRRALNKGTKPLLLTGNMRRTKKIPATTDKMRFIIKMDAKKGKNKRKVQYGAFHNEGFTNSFKSRYPNTKVPTRRWFGIPKSMRIGGKENRKWSILFKKMLFTASLVKRAR